MLARLLWEDDLHRPLAVLRREQIIMAVGGSGATVALHFLGSIALDMQALSPRKRRPLAASSATMASRPETAFAMVKSMAGGQHTVGEQSAVGSKIASRRSSRRRQQAAAAAAEAAAASVAVVSGCGHEGWWLVAVGRGTRRRRHRSRCSSFSRHCWHHHCCRFGSRHWHHHHLLACSFIIQFSARRIVRPITRLSGPTHSLSAPLRHEPCSTRLSSAGAALATLHPARSTVWPLADISWPLAAHDVLLGDAERTGIPLSKHFE